MKTKEEAVALYESGFWKTMNARSIAEFQLYEDRLCMPFEVFHKAMGEALGRPVYTHEFGLDRAGLIAEFEGKRPAPGIEDILDLFPDPSKVIVVRP